MTINDFTSPSGSTIVENVKNISGKLLKFGVLSVSEGALIALGNSLSLSIISRYLPSTAFLTCPV